VLDRMLQERPQPTRSLGRDAIPSPIVLVAAAVVVLRAWLRRRRMDRRGYGRSLRVRPDSL